jgi:Zn finger protein HypA/HybF involved in hydrogenase expression
MKIVETKGFCRCDNCNNVVVESINMEFGKISLCDKCKEILLEVLKGR